MSIDIESIASEKIDKIKDKEIKPSYSLEALTFLVLGERVDQLEDKVKTQAKGQKKRLEEIKGLQSLKRALNAATDEGEKLDFTDKPDLKELYDSMNKRFDLSLKDETTFSGAARERMIDNITMAVDERNLENDLQMNTLQQLNYERNEALQMLDKIRKTLHDAKMSITRYLAGR